MLHELMIGLFLACAGDKAADDSANDDTARGDSAETGGVDDSDSGGETAESGDSGETGDTASATLVGVPPEEPVPLPDFSATNRDGTGRGPEDLVGRPTVMWFYPAAATGG